MGTTVLPSQIWQPLRESSMSGKQLQLNWRIQKKSKLPTTSEYIISLFFHSSEGWYTRASTYAKMCIFMNMCFIKEWGRWKLSFAFSESFSLFQVLGNFFYHQSYLEKIVRHHFQFIVIRHRLSSNGKNQNI